MTAALVVLALAAVAGWGTAAVIAIRNGGLRVEATEERLNHEISRQALERAIEQIEVADKVHASIVARRDAQLATVYAVLRQTGDRGALSAVVVADIERMLQGEDVPSGPDHPIGRSDVP